MNGLRAKEGADVGYVGLPEDLYENTVFIYADDVLEKLRLGLDLRSTEYEVMLCL